jgi:hypothetical protein
MNPALIPENRVCIRQAGGIPVVIDAMQRHSTSAKVQEYGCGALLNLSEKHAHSVVSIVGSGGIECVIDAMQNFFE